MPGADMPDYAMRDAILRREGVFSPTHFYSMVVDHLWREWISPACCPRLRRRATPRSAWWSGTPSWGASPPPLRPAPERSHQGRDNGQSKGPCWRSAGAKDLPRRSLRARPTPGPGGSGSPSRAYVLHADPLPHAVVVVHPGEEVGRGAPARSGATRPYHPGCTLGGALARPGARRSRPRRGPGVGGQVLLHVAVGAGHLHRDPRPGPFAPTSSVSRCKRRSWASSCAPSKSRTMKRSTVCSTLPSMLLGCT